MNEPYLIDRDGFINMLNKLELSRIIAEYDTLHIEIDTLRAEVARLQEILSDGGLKVTRVDTPRNWWEGLSDEEMGRPKGGK